MWNDYKQTSGPTMSGKQISCWNWHAAAPTTVTKLLEMASEYMDKLDVAAGEKLAEPAGH